MFTKDSMHTNHTVKHILFYIISIILEARTVPYWFTWFPHKAQQGRLFLIDASQHFNIDNYILLYA